MNTSVDLRTVYAFAREFHQKSPNIGKMLYGEENLICWHFSFNFQISHPKLNSIKLNLLSFVYCAGTAGFRTL
jgi:hypothetical protein